MNLNLRPKEECTFDAVSLGEVMLRLDPERGRNSRQQEASAHGKAAESIMLSVACAAASVSKQQ